MFDRWTSITGPSKAFSASRMAMEVWVKAPGLMTMAAALSRASWIQSISSYSRLDWWQRGHAFGLGSGGAEEFDVGEGFAAVDLGLALAKQVQVRAVQDKDRFGGRGHGWPFGLRLAVIIGEVGPCRNRGIFAAREVLQLCVRPRGKGRVTLCYKI